MCEDRKLKKLALKFLIDSCKYKYSYNFNWLGRPIIQYPQDIIALQEIIWLTKPDLIIETGIAHGGSLIFSASMLELIGNNGLVVGIDIDIRKHNKIAIQKHPLFKRIKMIEASSIDKSTIQTVKKYVKGKKSILVYLDSNHTEEHVLKELELYSPFVTKNNYLIVFDTVVNDMPDSCFTNRPWKKGDSPKTAVKKFLKNNRGFIIDTHFDKLLISVAPSGYLKKIK